ncbi:hypothetical protein JCM9279_001713 [Rhodotorula babjevae]
MAAMPSFDYVDDPPQPLVCPICRDVLDDPVTTPTCQHLYCRTCLDRALDLAPSCPVCRTRLDSLADRPPAPRAIRHLVADLAIQCTTCHTRMRRDDWLHHQLACAEPDHPPSSPAAQDADDAPSVEHCALCSADLPAADTQAHPSLCPAAHVPCAYCALHLPRASHPAHLLSTCPAVPSPCPHAPHGCPWLGPRSSSANSASTTALDDHLAHECVYEPLRDYLALVDGRMRELEGDNWALRARVKRCEDALDEVRGLAGALRGAMGEFAPTGVRGGGDGGGDKAQRSPTRRARSPSPSSSPSLPVATATPPAASPPASLPATLAALSTTAASHTAQLSSLAHAHAQHAQHAADELASVRAQLGGVRAQVAQWAMLLHERERDREREREGWARASWARRTGLGPRTASDELPLSASASAAAALGAVGELGDSGGSSGSDDEYGLSSSSGARPFGAPLPPMGSSYPGGAGTYPSAFRRGPGPLMGVPLPPGLRLVPQQELLLGGGGGGGMGAPGWDGMGGGRGAYGYGAHEVGAMLGGAGGGGLGPGGGGGPGRARGAPIPMGGAGAVKL